MGVGGLCAVVTADIVVALIYSCTLMKNVYVFVQLYSRTDCDPNIASYWRRGVLLAARSIVTTLNAYSSRLSYCFQCSVPSCCRRVILRSRYFAVCGTWRILVLFIADSAVEMSSTDPW
jgi:hypothetical protein